MLAILASTPSWHLWYSRLSRDRWLRVILILWSLEIIFAFAQVVPLPASLIAIVSPTLNDLYNWTLPGYTHKNIGHALSTTPASTIHTGLLSAACAAAFILVLNVCHSQKRIITLAYALILIGLLEGIYGLAVAGGRLAPATGTFVSRNHFAAFLAMALCVNVGVLLARREDAATGFAVDRYVRTFPLILSCLIILAGIIFSYSRMGLIAPIVMLALFGGLWMIRPGSRPLRFVVGTIVLILALFAIGAWRGIEVLAERFQDLEDIYRLAVWDATYSLFKTSPFWGIGLGGFVDNIPRFLPAFIHPMFHHAHNEPLEALAEGGVLYASVMGLGLLVYFKVSIRGWLMRGDTLARGLGTGCLAAAGAVLLQSLVEFPLRMPANAFYLSVVMGLGWVVIHDKLPKSRHVDTLDDSATVKM